MKALVATILFFPISVLALETDNYLVWGKELKDSSRHINRFFREGIEASLKKIPDHDSKSCDEMTKLIAKDFASFLVHDNPVENWLFSVLNSEEIYPATLNYVEESIYREPYLFYIPWFGLAPNIQVSGFYFGTDKLSHFASTGMNYYRIFRKELKRGSTIAEAEKAAINWGIKDEKSVHGYWASGVFSYADLESNYQGLQFYRRFCESDSSYLSRVNGNWELVRYPEIRNFVSAFWDETFELSYRLPENWKKVAPVLREHYCPMRNSRSVSDRFAYYQKSVSSNGRDYLYSQRESGLVPVPQSFSRECR